MANQLHHLAAEFDNGVFRMADNGSVLIIDDDTELIDTVREYLVGNGFEVDEAHTYASGLAAAASGENDLVVLDVMLPGGSGLDLLRELRTKSFVPVLLLSAGGDADDRANGLEIGADDYLLKPFDPHELVARMRAILRRARCPDGPVAEDSDWIRVRDLALSPGLRKATCGNKELFLTSVEFNVLECLLRHRGSVVAREELVRVALGRQLGMLDRSIDVHISRLRRKIEECGAMDIRIKSIRGTGYIYPALPIQAVA
jgi:DNA-binding response OmpR family regulator